MLEIALYVLLGIAVLVAAVIAYAATRPDTFRVARSIRIAVAPEAIFPFLDDFRKSQLWSPYETKDPDMKRTLSGPESGPGARYDWDGDKNVGKGSLVITDSVAPSRVAIDLSMVSPMRVNNHVAYTLEPEGDGATRVTWSMEGRAPLIAKVLHLFCNMDRMVGADFETGLQNLKALAERG